MNIPYRVSRRHGYTLVEVLIASFISTIVTIAVLSMFIAAAKLSVESFMRNQAAMQARSVMDHLTTDARVAVGVESSYGSYTASSSTLILKVPAITATGLPVDIDTNFDRIVYHQGAVNKNDLIRTVITDASSARESGDTVVGSSAKPQIGIESTFSVQPDALGAYVIHYEFISVQDRGSKQYTKPIAGSIRLRNKGAETTS